MIPKAPWLHVRRGAFSAFQAVRALRDDWGSPCAESADCSRRVLRCDQDGDFAGRVGDEEKSSGLTAVEEMKQEKTLRVRWDTFSEVWLSGSYAKAEPASKSSRFWEHLRGWTQIRVPLLHASLGSVPKTLHFFLLFHLYCFCTCTGISRVEQGWKRKLVVTLCLINSFMENYCYFLMGKLFYGGITPR